MSSDQVARYFKITPQGAWGHCTQLVTEGRLVKTRAGKDCRWSALDRPGDAAPPKWATRLVITPSSSRSDVAKRLAEVEADMAELEAERRELLLRLNGTA